MSIICGPDYITLGPSKSSGRYTTAHMDSKIGVRINCGCFSGTLDEFISRIHSTHNSNPEILSQYLLFVKVIKNYFKLS